MSEMRSYNLAGLALLLSFCSPQTHPTFNELQQTPGRIDFIPGRIYSLKECHQGNYIKTNQNKSIGMTYFDYKNRIYQQALFAYNPATKDTIAVLVELDFDKDNHRDLTLAADPTGYLRILNYNKDELNKYIGGDKHGM